MDINGGESGDDIDEVDIPTEPHPTRRDVHSNLDNWEVCQGHEQPIAQKMEAILGSFSRKLRLEEAKTIKNTAPTDFFQRA